MAARHPALQAAVRLREALDQTAAALAEGRLEGLLAGEAALQDASAIIPSASDLPAGERQALRVELESASRALVRCRHLGASLTAFVRISLDAQGLAVGYGPHRTTTSALDGRTLNTRV